MMGLVRQIFKKMTVKKGEYMHVRGDNKKKEKLYLYIKFT